MRRPQRRRAGARLLVCGLLLPAALAAAPAAGATPKGPQQAGAAPAAASCTLRDSGSDEWGRCLKLDASLSRVPAIGETAQLDIALQAAVARNATVEVLLPAGLELAGSPGGLRPAAAPRSDGTVASELVATRAVAAHATQHLTLTLRAVAAGAGQIRVLANAPAPGGADGAADDVFLTVGETSGASRAGIATPSVLGVKAGSSDLAPAARPGA